MARLAPLVLAAALLGAAAAGANQTSGQDAGRTQHAGKAAGAPASGGEGRRLFTEGTTPSCATCHVLGDAEATGNIGPDLDALQPDAARVRNAVEKGFEAMPAFGHVLSAQQLDTLARYVEQAARTKR